MLKQKVFCFGDDFTIRDELGRDAFFVDGKALSFGDKLSFQDMQGNELAYIAQRLLAWGPTYEITHRGSLVAVVKKTLFTFFRCEFTVDVPGPNDLVASGDFMDHEYTFGRSGRAVAEVSKRWFTWSDTYAVEMADMEDPVLILASVIVIDLCCHGDKRQ